MVTIYHKNTGVVLWQTRADMLQGADLSHANLFSADLKGMNLAHANLSGANLCAADLEGAIVTADAMSTQKAIAHQIVEQKANYVLPLKDNQPNLRADVESYLERVRHEQFRDAQDNDIPHTTVQTRDNDHGRLETRTCWALECPDWVEGFKEWRNLRSIACIESQRKIDGVTSVEYRYFISSLPPQAKLIAHAVRSHWGIENSLHWILDVALREDDSRIREGHAPQNMATLRHITLNMLKQDAKSKLSIRRKRLVAGWKNSYLQQILTKQF